MTPLNPIKQPDTQLRVLALLVGAGFAVLLAGLWYVQVFSSKKFADSLEDQAVRSVRMPAVRGKIVDRNGQPFAENRPTYNVELYLAELGKHFHAEYVRLRPAGARLTRAEREQLEWAARYNVVSNITAQVGDWLQQPQVIDQRKFQRHYNEVRALPISILQNLNAVQVARFAERPGVFPGLDLEIQPLRVYPHGSLAAHVLGSLTRDDSSQEEEDAFYHYRLPDWKGQTGMEGVFDGQLRGTAGTRSMTVNRLGYRQQETVLRAPEPGDNVVLTLDFKLQRAVEAALVTSMFGAQTRGALTARASGADGGEETLDRLEVERVARHHDEVVRTGLDEPLPVVDLVRADGDGALDLPRVAAQLRAPVVEDRVLRREVLRGTEGVPRVGELGHDLQGDLLAGSTDEDRQRSLRGGRQLREALLDERQVAAQCTESLRRGAELVAVLGVVALEPARTDAEHEPTVREQVGGARHVREQLGVPVRVAGDERADGRVTGVDGHRGEHRVALVVVGLRVAVQRVEVVPHPQRVDAERVGRLPGVAQVLDGRGLRVELDTDLACGHGAS